MAMAKKKTPAKKKTAKKLNNALSPTFRLVWKDNDGIERSLVVGTMTWGSISMADALNLEKIIGEAIVGYYNGTAKKAKKAHAK